MIQVTRIRFEHHDYPTIAVGESTQRISWSLDGDESNWTQTSYEIEVERNDGSKQTFRQDSAQSTFVTWPDKPLKSRETAKLRVRVSGQHGDGEYEASSEWSDPVDVEAGLLSSHDWQCQLIEPTDPTSGSEPRPALRFRRLFDVESATIRARLYITAHGVYQAYLNGTCIGNAILEPGWTSYKNRLTYQTFNISDYLKKGANEIKVEVGEGWYVGRLGYFGGSKDNYGDEMGLIAMIVLEQEDGSEVTLGTDESWEWALSPITSSGIYDGETRVFGNHDESWHKVKASPVTDTLVAPDGPPVREQEAIVAKEIITSPTGKTIVDFGQNFVGYVRVKVNAPTKTEIKFQYVEVLEHGEASTRPLRHAKACDTLIFEDAAEVIWSPSFTFHGFRYVEIVGWPGELDTSAIAGIVLHTDMRRTGYFACSNPLLNKLHENILWSMRGNFLSIPTDCPQRDERLGWTGDLNMFAPTANYLYSCSGMLTSWLKDLALEQAALNGTVPLFIPSIASLAHRGAHTIWGDVAIMLPWCLYQTTADASILQAQYHSMRTWLEAIPRHPNGLWHYVETFKLADWLDPASPPDDPGNATTDPEFVSNCFLIHVTDLMSNISHILNDSASTIYSSTSKSLRAAFAHEYITPSGLLSPDTQTAYTLALRFNLFPTQSQIDRAISRLVSIIHDQTRWCIGTGFAGTPYLPHAFSAHKEANTFYRMLLHKECPSWLYPVTMGATTIWERWDSMLPDGRVNPGEMTSFNHYAFGSVGAWMYENIGGLRQGVQGGDEPGWKVWTICPLPGGGLTWGEGRYVSAYGDHRVRWEIEQDNDGGGMVLRIRFHVPLNTTAKVVLPLAEGSTPSAAKTPESMSMVRILEGSGAIEDLGSNLNQIRRSNISNKTFGSGWHALILPWAEDTNWPPPEPADNRHGQKKDGQLKEDPAVESKDVAGMKEWGMQFLRNAR